VWDLLSPSVKDEFMLIEIMHTAAMPSIAAAATRFRSRNIIMADPGWSASPLSAGPLFRH
jgi:hypothetical protein